MATSKSEIRKAEKVVDEIREIRRRLWDNAGRDVDSFLNQLNRDIPWKDLKKASVEKKATSKRQKQPRTKIRGR